ncbi:MAG: hypothetical protein MUC35_01155 [Candidatus Margulisbacteria bacterium]|jgi:hypothetical protein|nr:hypothetical protein [Candidatus Margulisiibacteriota bacterium]
MIRPFAPEYYPRSARKYAGTIAADSELASIVSRGRPFRAAYLVVGDRLHLCEQGHIVIINRLGNANLDNIPPSHYGWIKVLPPERNRSKPIIIIDCHSDYNSGRRPEQRWDLLSLDEYFAFFYVVLVKSGVTDFSLRLTSGGKRAAGINERNWRSESSLLFDNETIEAEFIRQLRASLRDGIPLSQRPEP